jgi:hypothetical protein
MAAMLKTLPNDITRPEMRNLIMTNPTRIQLYHKNIINEFKYHNIPDRVKQMQETMKNATDIDVNLIQKY